MENQDIKLVHKKKNLIDKLTELFIDKKKRYLYMCLLILPFVIAIGIFGFITYKEAKNIIELAKGESSANPAYSIPSMNYVLRDNATDIQFEYFTELKNAVEQDNADDKTIAGLVGKNFVADFYTWTNKQGQYDVGGLYYFCDSKMETIKYKNDFFTKARDGFYKYLNEYINEYGSSNLLEVTDVQIVSCEELGYPYTIYELKDKILQDDGDLLRVYDNVDHEAYYVSLKWTYNPETKLDLNKFATSVNLIVMKDEENHRFEIVEISEKFIDANQQEENEVIEEIESEEE